MSLDPSFRQRIRKQVGKLAGYDATNFSGAGVYRKTTSGQMIQRRAVDGYLFGKARGKHA
jgi:hypothetical protein